MQTIARVMCCALSIVAIAGCATTTSPGAAPRPAYLSPGAASNPNVAVALGYLDMVWNQHKPVEGFAKYVAPNEIHYPGKPGEHDPESLAKFLKGFPDFKYEFKHVYADGAYVIVHSLVTGVPGTGQLVSSPQPNTKPLPKVGDEVVDIFRVENGKLVEQWDVVEAVRGTADGLF